MFQSPHLAASWVEMLVWRSRSTSLHVVWECGVAIPVQGDGKPVKRVHLNPFESLKLMFWGIGALMSQSLVWSIQCPSNPFKKDKCLNSYHHCCSRISPHGGAGVYLCMRSSCPVSWLYCASYFQSAVQSCLCPFILFLSHKPWETRLYSSRDQRTHTKHVLPHAVLHVVASSKWPRTSETTLRNMEK